MIPLKVGSHLEIGTDKDKNYAQNNEELREMAVDMERWEIREAIISIN